METHIAMLNSNKISETKISARVIEAWLNETLTDAGQLDIPGVLLKPESQKPLCRYQIDKNQLAATENGLEFKQSERIHRALFVYSLGFYQMLTNELKASPN